MSSGFNHAKPAPETREVARNPARDPEATKFTDVF